MHLRMVYLQALSGKPKRNMIHVGYEVLNPGKDLTKLPSKYIACSQEVLSEQTKLVANFSLRSLCKS